MITSGKVVSITYRLTNDKGEELERTQTGHPFRYVHGASTIVAGLEAGLTGRKAGEALKITVPPGQAYGEFNPSLKKKMERSLFPSEQPVEVGELFRVTEADGSACVYEVEKIDPEAVYVNANHPLAGKTLKFDVRIVDVRDATAEEQASGHVAGAGA